jgi:peptidoglycan hydrolase-like protein with peptidoglycan-binding domain
MGGIGPSPSAITLAGPLMLGSRGKDVQTLQSLLNQATVPSPALAEDSIFGIKTDAAVRAFQRRKGLQPDGIVGPRTAQALGVNFVLRPQPAPRPDPPGTTPHAATVVPEAVLLGTIAKELKQIREKIDTSFDNGYNDAPEVYDRARNYLRSGLKQALFVLANAARGGMPADFVAGQANLAIFVMVKGLGVVTAQLVAGGCDASDVIGMLTDLMVTSAQVGDVVRKTLTGQIEGGLRAGVRQLRNLFDPLVN